MDGFRWRAFSWFPDSDLGLLGYQFKLKGSRVPKKSPSPRLKKPASPCKSLYTNDFLILGWHPVKKVVRFFVAPSIRETQAWHYQYRVEKGSG